MRKAVDIDLQSIPPPYGKPLRRFIWHGVIPDLPDLFMLLCGDRSQRHHDVHAVDGHGLTPIVIIAAFLDKHQADLDIAHGHLALVLRWQWLGGMAGR